MSQFYCSEDELHGESGAWQIKLYKENIYEHSGIDKTDDNR